jgi:flavin-dependent dehydrogenase
MRTADVLIVGGGPAGSTCAWKLKAAGLDVVLLDKAEFPRLKLCAGWITPQAVEDLELEIDAYPHRFLTFERLECHWRALRFRKKTTQHSIRRFEFDDFLLRRCGAEVVTHKVKRIERAGDDYIIDNRYRAPCLVGAGGTACPVYRTFFAAPSPRAKPLQIATFEQEFPYDWDNEDCILWFFDGGLPGYAWYVPKAKGYINIGLGGRADKIKSQSMRVQDYWAKFTRKLSDEGLVTDVDFDPSGYSYYLRGSVDTVRRGNAFIIGDAVGLASVDMGEGIGPAVRSAILAADAILGNADYRLHDLERYSIPGIAGRVLAGGV